MKKSTISIIVVSTYNGLVTLEQEVDAQWAKVEVQYQRRLDLIPNLVETVKGYAAHESNTLESVTRARAGLTDAYNTADSLKNAVAGGNAQAFESYNAAQSSLNRALRRRVYELDKPAFKFAVTEIDTLSNRTLQLSATVPVSQNESLLTSQKIMASNLKYRGSRVISLMKDFLTDLNRQKAMTGRVLLDKGISTGLENRLIPVIVWEGCGGRLEGDLEHFTMPEICLSDRTRNAITNHIATSNVQFPWTDAAAPDKRVADSFKAMLGDFEATERIKETMGRLFEANRIQTFNAR